MKIIKVVHADSAEALNQAAESFSIQTFDVEKFVAERLKELNNVWVNMATATPLLIGGLVAGYKDKRMREHFKKSCIALVEELRSATGRTEVLPLDFALKKYPRTQNLSVGTFALHPFDSKRLTRLEHYHTNLAMEKDDELVVLLGKMGAKTVRVVEADTENKSGSVKLGAETVPTSVTGKANISQHIEVGKELLVTFEGHAVEVDPNLLNTSLWFSTDSKLSSILASRRFAPNKITSYTLRNTYTETFDFNFELAVRYMVVKTDLKAEYNSLSKKERFFHVEFGR